MMISDLIVLYFIVAWCLGVREIYREYKNGGEK